MAATADRPASRGTWGREPPRTEAQKLEAARRFFAAFRPPGRWRFEGWNQVAEAGGRVLSVRAVFRDGGTAYAVCFVLAPERGAICERTTGADGRARYRTVASNKTAEALTQWAEEHYENDKNDKNQPPDGLDALREKIRNL